MIVQEITIEEILDRMDQLEQTGLLDCGNGPAISEWLECAMISNWYYGGES